jgi:hypothetical protein
VRNKGRRQRDGSAPRPRSAGRRRPAPPDFGQQPVTLLKWCNVPKAGLSQTIRRRRADARRRRPPAIRTAVCRNSAPPRRRLARRARTGPGRPSANPIRLPATCR